MVPRQPEQGHLPLGKKQREEAQRDGKKDQERKGREGGCGAGLRREEEGGKWTRQGDQPREHRRLRWTSLVGGGSRTGPQQRATEHKDTQARGQEGKSGPPQTSQGQASGLGPSCPGVGEHSLPGTRPLRGIPPPSPGGPQWPLGPSHSGDGPCCLAQIRLPLCSPTAGRVRPTSDHSIPGLWFCN